VQFHRTVVAPDAPKGRFNQIKDVENSFLAIDGVEFGRGKDSSLVVWIPVLKR
jgi:hypothetical protein